MQDIISSQSMGYEIDVLVGDAKNLLTTHNKFIYAYISNSFVTILLNQMCHFFPNLLGLLLVASGTILVIPCQAQNLQEYHQENTNQSDRASSNTNIKSNLDNGDHSGNNQLEVISKSNNNEVTTTKPNLRIPISSRIFATPSMKQ
ncbi:hypothetical protein [Fischerella thermalis]|uniref:hypothetical protein n=1 Tax=Fischerella thermalis TaxID=372787 RepID=UPI0021558052|nr:hypothetical protein [Fischerella thermalis]